MPPGPPPPGWGPPGPRRPNNNSAVVIIVLAVFVLLVGGGAIVWWGSGDSNDDPVTAAPTLPGVPTLPGAPVPPSYSPPPLPGYTPYSPPDTYSPPPQHYGAIAVAPDGSVGKAWDYKSMAAAKQRALKECPRSNCKVLVSFVNGCGAVALNSRTNRYWGGHGDTRTAAQKSAVSNAGGGHWITWVCTTR